MNWFFGANIVFSLGATVAGITAGVTKDGWASWSAAVLGALAAATLTVQRNYNFDMRTQWYGKAITRCDRFLNILKVRAQTNDDLYKVQDSFDQMRAEEGSWGSGVNPDVASPAGGGGSVPPREQVIIHPVAEAQQQEDVAAKGGHNE